MKRMRTGPGQMSLEPVPSRPLQGKGRAVSASGRPDRRRIEHGPSKPGARQAARGPRDRPGRASSPPVPGSRCGVNCPEGQFNITGCCAHSPHSQAELARCVRMRATPVMSCAPQRLLRKLKAVRPMGPQGLMARRRKRRVMEGWPLPAHPSALQAAPAPAGAGSSRGEGQSAGTVLRPRSAPQGGSPGVAHISPYCHHRASWLRRPASVAPCSPRQGSGAEAPAA